MIACFTEALHVQLLELRSAGIGILISISDHNVKEALSLCDRAYVLFAGRMLAEGTSDELSVSVVVRERFLGETFAWAGRTDGHGLNLLQDVTP